MEAWGILRAGVLGGLGGLEARRPGGFLGMEALHIFRPGGLGGLGAEGLGGFEGLEAWGILRARVLGGLGGLEA